MESTNNLSICGDCGKEPSIYGDGLTWGRGAACEQKRRSAKGETVSTQPQVPSGESFPHLIEKGLVSIILPVYINSYSLFHYTGNCIGSIKEHTDMDNCELVVVDNGSPIKPPELSSYYADRVIVNEENLGVTKAWNQGIRMSTGEYIVLINNDVQVFTGWLEDMRAALDDGLDLVMAHPMYSLTEPFARAAEADQVRRGLKVLDRLEKDFSCVMFRRSLLEEIGVFDERFFNYTSDSDLFRRMDEKGKKWKMLDKVAIHHISDATGFSIIETPDIMNKDKAAFKEKWENKPVIASNFKIDDKHFLLARSKATGDGIYLNGMDEKYHHIKTPEVLHAMGLEFGMEKEIEKIGPIGEAITMENFKKYL